MKTAGQGEGTPQPTAWRWVMESLQSLDGDVRQHAIGGVVIESACLERAHMSSTGWLYCCEIAASMSKAESASAARYWERSGGDVAGVWPGAVDAPGQ